MVDTGPKTEGLAGSSKNAARKVAKPGAKGRRASPARAAGRRQEISQNLPKVLRIGIIQSGKILEELDLLRAVATQ